METTSFVPNESLALKNLVMILERGPVGQRYNMTILCDLYQVKRRALYDFVVVGTTFGACSRKTNNDFEWLGLKKFMESIPAMAEKFEVECSNQSLESLFDCSDQPLLGKLATYIIKLFVYLHETKIDIRQAAKLFSQEGTKYKTMLRKLYTLISCFEVAGVITRTTFSGEIQLLIPYTYIVKSPYSIQSLVKNEGNSHIYESHRALFKSRIGSQTKFVPINPIPQQQIQTTFPAISIFSSVPVIAPPFQGFSAVPSIIQMGGHHVAII